MRFIFKGEEPKRQRIQCAYWRSHRLWLICNNEVRRTKYIGWRGIAPWPKRAQLVFKRFINWAKVSALNLQLSLKVSFLLGLGDCRPSITLGLCSAIQMLTYQVYLKFDSTTYLYYVEMRYSGGLVILLAQYWAEDKRAQTYIPLCTSGSLATHRSTKYGVLTEYMCSKYPFDVITNRTGMVHKWTMALK